MHRKLLDLAVGALVGSLVIVGGGCSGGGAGGGDPPEPPDLKEAGEFSILAGSGVATGGTIRIDGDVGVSPGDTLRGFPPGDIDGDVHLGNEAAARAQLDLAAAMDDLASRPVDEEIDTELGGRTLGPGVYRLPGSAVLSDGNLVLDGGFDSDAVFIFQVEEALITAGNEDVVLLNGARASSVYWQVGDSATISSGTTLRGNVLAGKSITVASNARIDGRVLAHRGSVTFQRRDSLDWAGLRRTFLLHVPLSRDPGTPAPLVLALHGGEADGDGTVLLTLGKFNDLAEEEGFVVAYPDGVDGHWNDGRGVDAYRAHRDDIDDVGFIAALIDKLVDEENVDPARVYATGVSNGGHMVQRLACQLSGRLAAAAPVIGAIPENIVPDCTPARGVPLLSINGTHDPLEPWEGGHVHYGDTELGRVLSVEATMELWAELSGCSTDPERVLQPDLDPDDGARVSRWSYTGCQDGSEVVLYVVLGGGHTWPDGWQYIEEDLIGPTCRDFDACQTIWEFFSRHSLD